MPEDSFSKLGREAKKQTLLAMKARLAEAARPEATPDALHPRRVSAGEPHEPFPLTDLQAAYFVAKQMPESDPVGCHTYIEFPVADLDVGRLEHAWRRLLDIHPMLRARVEKDGTQCIPPAAPAFTIPQYEVAADAAALERHLEAVRAEMSHRIYAADEWPLFDIRVTHSLGSASRVHVSMDSWIIDGASAGLVYRQWRLLYDQPDADLPAPEATFRDYVLSMKEFEGSAGHRRCVEYWSEKLRDLPERLRLPYRASDEARRTGDAHRRRRLHWTLMPEHWQRFKEAVAAEDVSPSVALLGVFAEQLRNFGWGDRFALILTLNNRPRFHPQVDQVVGPFGSTSVFIIEHDPARAFVERLRLYQRQLWRDLDHGYVSGVAAMRHAAGGAHTQPSPVVFTSALGLREAAGASWLDDVDEAVSQTPGVDLHFQSYERADGLHLAWDVAYGRFEPSLIDALFESVCLNIAQLAATGLSESEGSLPERALREYRLAQIRSESAGGGDIPLTPLQQSYLAHRLIHPDEPPGAVYREFELSNFDPAGLQAALDTMLSRSAVLRSVLRAERAKLVEFGNASYPIPVKDLRGLDAERRCQRLEESRAEMKAALRGAPGWPPFALRAWVLEGGAARLQVLLDLLVFDGHGVWLFYDELWRTYGEDVGKAPPPQLTYGEYTRARERYRGTAAYAADRSYWARKFRDLPPGPSWPRPAAAGPPLSRRYTLEFNRWQVLKEGAASRGLPPGAVLSALYAEVLRRLSERRSLTVTVVSYRQRGIAPDFARGYGDFSSLAWLSGDGDPSLSLEEHLSWVADTLTRDRLHDWGNPLEALRSSGVRDEHGGGLGAVLTDCLDVVTPTRVGVTEVCAASWTPGVDVDLMAVETESGLSTYWQVRTDRVGSAVATSMLDEFRGLLQELAADDSGWQRPLAELGLRTSQREGSGPRAARQSHAMHVWNSTDTDYDREQCVHRLIERQAARDPNRVSLLSNEGSLTYGQLDRRANQLSMYLKRRGVGRGELVGVLLDRSLDTIVALVAILKAGAAYVPLSVSDPRSRIASMLARAGVHTVVSKRPYKGLLDAERRVVLLDESQAVIEAEDGDRPPAVNSSPADIAYVIFTSGSTGEPKGVTVCHRPVINLIEWAGKAFGLSHDDRVLFVNSLGFDLSVFDVFAVLAHGGSVHIVSEDDRLDPARLAGLLLNESITLWNSAPAYLQFVLPSLKTQVDAARGAKLRIVLLSGDWIPLSLPGDVRRVCPGAKVIGLGGATETTVWANYYPIEDIAPGWASIPYGRPIQNARYYILDEHLQPAAVGDPGHLYIGGECLSSGYVNAPELTASRFLPDPFHERPGMTMYDTGDLARFMDDGNIEFLGRADNQIKLRGFRIELGEVEAALAQSGLSSPVAVVREDAPGTRLIIAFGTWHSTHGPLTDESFWRGLRGRLPDYMIPSRVYALASLPMTKNGKVDRQRLKDEPLDSLLSPAPGGGLQRTSDAAIRVAPAPPLPAFQMGSLTNFLCPALARILSLGAEAVQPDTHFSALGVNSLHFALLCAQLTEATGVTISPAKLFHCTSVAEIGEALAERFPQTLAPDLAADEPTAVLAPMSVEDARSRPPEAERAPLPGRAEESASGELAVVGIHCIMPQADGPEDFWRNLVNGRHCVELIPRDRWDWRAYYGDPNSGGGVTQVNRAGFIRDIDKFDAGFFGISPREAELMDPRQRMMLEGVWKTIEDAGYNPADLRHDRVGVYVGATGDEYASLMQQSGHPADQFSLTGAGRSFLANRVSYYYGWHGPSEVVDTTCSSSLVALHNAARAIQSGDCSMAIVGGLNIMIDPFPHLSLAKVGVLSPDGACKTFDASANGYVRGEGLGLLLVKPLRQAELDHDHIYAVISGTAVNHGGRAQALTAPNPRAQAGVIVDAYRCSSVDPRQVGYVEAHGTGTPLGDPIEIEGLKEAFTTLYRDRGQALAAEKRVSVGSVKTCIGHLEAAAGISGVIKAILMLRHKTLPPVVHLKTLNPQIDVDGTPFFFQIGARAWEAPADDEGHALPRAASVSGFGIGGVNAHAVVREYLPQATSVRGPERPTATVIPLSARGAEQLAQYAERLRDALRAGCDGLRLEDVAFTLRVGREDFVERAAVVTSSLDQLVEQLDAISRGSATTQGVYYGNARSDAKKLSPELADTPPEALAALPPHELARLWAYGLTVDWRQFYGERLPNRTPLPTYPFARVRHWPAWLHTQSSGQRLPRLVESEDGARPGYVLSLLAEAFFIRDHRIDGEHIMPAAAYLGYAASVAERLYGEGSITVRGMVWTRPLRFADELPRRLHLSLTPRGDAHQLAFLGEEAGEQVEYSSALLAPATPQSRRPFADIEALKRRCPEQHAAEVCYERLEELGITYGSSLRVIRTLWLGESEAIAHIALSEDLAALAPEQRLHPSTIDGALQVALLHQALHGDSHEVHLPFTVREATSHRTLPRECYMHARLIERDIGRKALRRYNLTVLAPDGEVLLELEECTGLPLKRQAVRGGGDTQLFREDWRAVESEVEWKGRVGSPPLTRAYHLCVGLPTLADLLCSAGQRVLANALLPVGSVDGSGGGSAVPWDNLLKGLGERPPEAFVLWYDRRAVASLPPNEQLRFGFDTVFELTKRLLAARRLGRCQVALCLLSASAREDLPTLEALSGFVKVVQHENPKLTFKLVHCTGIGESELPACEPLLRAVEAALDSGPQCVEHKFNLVSGTHSVLRLAREVGRSERDVLPVERGGVYLITGGAGAIGGHLTRALLQQGTRVALVGRSPAASEQAEALKALDPAAHVHYFQADVTDAAALRGALAAIHATLGEVRGVFHCAGEANGGLLMFKSLSAAREVIAAKVLGTVCLDEATRAEPLDFFVLFSSLASVTGPVGAGDYAYANRFADLYAAYRNSFVARGLRRGQTLAVSWPVWSDGGMRLPSQDLDYMRARGLETIDNARAVGVLAHCLRAGGGHYICAHGDRTRAEAFLASAYSGAASPPHEVSRLPAQLVGS
jgi:amino acid adenylation domain-containing protein